MYIRLLCYVSKQLLLSFSQIDFGEVRFQQTKQVTLELVNTGQIPCGFEFICRPGEENPCKQWLTISKSKGIMLKGKLGALLALLEHWLQQRYHSDY